MSNKHAHDLGLGHISLASDNVFRDGATSQLASVSGSAGYEAQLTVGVRLQ